MWYISFKIPPFVRCMYITSQLGQQYIVLTVDQALYLKLMDPKWSVPEYKDKLIPRLSGLHISMNFLKVIGQHMKNSGLCEAWPHGSRQVFSELAPLNTS